MPSLEVLFSALPALCITRLGRLLRELHVPSKQHGPLYSDGWFSLGPAWSPDESRIAYVAEEPPTTETPKWSGAAKTDGQEATDALPTATPKSWQGIGEYQEDWGELNTGKKTPALFVLDAKTWQVSRITNLPAEHSIGQPVWSPEGDQLVFTAWPHSPPNAPQFGNRLGIVYCMNRPCSLFAVPVPPSSSQSASGEPVLLTPGRLSACSPRFLSDGSKLVFLSNEPAAQTMTHMGTAELLTLDWPGALQNPEEGSAHTLVPVVQQSDLEEFPGLYPHALSESCFAGGNEFVLLTSQWRSRMALLAIDLKTGKVQDTGFSNQSWSLLGAGQGWVAAAASSPTQPPRLMLARLPSASTASKHSQWEWTALGPLGNQTTPDAVQSTLDGLQWQTYQVKAMTDPTDMPFEAVVVRPKGKAALPGVLFPHGGPHSAFPAAYSNLVAFQAAQGYAVIAVNFRGSTGFGEDSIQSLPGHISVNDVEDCIAALDHVIAEGVVDRDRVAVSGGSHGGFLTGNLLGRHADRFKAGLARNPVMDLSLMIHVSDIPDWCYVEAFGVQEAKRRMAARPAIEDLARFKEGGTAKVIVFPEDTHALDRPQTEFETMINMISWLQQHI
ncbi:hypothetical protein WJX84_011555 [Apatococcus fuscideae]|uniref:Prolyl endopeptidase n=1 Tax=Apatococcus fuscideae TaxID=2026836 RepID=A0AAW1T099_9CHLO